MQFTSFSLELLLDVEDMVLGVLQGLDELAALGCLSSQGGLHCIGREGTLLDDGLGGGELLLHVEDVLFGLAEVVFCLERSVDCLVQLGLLLQKMVVEGLELGPEGRHSCLTFLVEPRVIFKAFLGLVNLLKRCRVPSIILRVHNNGQFLILRPQPLNLPY